MEQKFVITITNQFCSEGRIIADRLGELLGIPCYNKQLTEMTAEMLNIPQSLVEENEERSKRIIRDTMFPMFARLGDSTSDIQNEIFHTQHILIKELAEKENCIIVGRCADFILNDRKDILDIHIFAPFETRVSKCVDYFNMDWESSIRLVRKTDEERDAYHLNYTGYIPTDYTHKDFLINSAVLGVEGTAHMLEDIVRHRFNIQQ